MLITSFLKGTTFENISEQSDRYSMYKVGPVLSVNHGIGCPSMSILIHELIKLLHYAECKDVTFFRIGTCGGVGIEPGTLVVTEEAVDGKFRPEYRQVFWAHFNLTFNKLNCIPYWKIILGEEKFRPTKANKQLVQELLNIGKENENKNGIKQVINGKTLCADDFYEGQGRVDGAFCDYTIESKFKFLQKCYDSGIKNIEM